MSDQLASPAFAPPSTTQVMISPDGQTGDVPVENVQDALQNGFKMAHDMIAPDGTHGVIPVDQAENAVKAGFKPAGAPTLPNTAPDALSRINNGINGARTAISSDPNIQAAIGAGEGATNVTTGLGPVKYAAGLIKSAFPATDLIHDVMDIPSEYRAYENARSQGASVTDAANIAAQTYAQKNQAIAQLKDAVKEFSANPGRATGKTIAELLPVIIGGGLAAPEATVAGDLEGSTADATHAYDPATGAVNPTVRTIKPEWLTKRPEVPAVQHGTPLAVESPLDSATVGKQLGGKDLSQEALDALHNHVGDTIPVGSSAKNMLTKAVEPVTKTIQDTANQMKEVVSTADPFETPVSEDLNYVGVQDGLKKSVPPSSRAVLSEDIDEVFSDSKDALNSKDPAQVLAQRQMLGKQIDWDSIEKNPGTPAEAQNAARAKIYKLLGAKLHDEIPETVELDKILSPNIELRSHMIRKLGERVVDDPAAATAEHLSELNKGKAVLDKAAHDAKVTRNWQAIKIAAGAVGGGELLKILGLL
jgi:hypothetical protein